MYQSMYYPRRRPVEQLSTKRQAITKWLRVNYPKLGVCEDCGARGRTHYVPQLPGTYTHDIEDYREICESCHLSERKPRSTEPQAIHKWLRINHPKTEVCEECRAEGPTHYAFKRHPEPYTRDRDDYRELCARCHRAYDAWLGLRFPGGELRAA